MVLILVHLYRSNGTGLFLLHFYSTHLLFLRNIISNLLYLFNQWLLFVNLNTNILFLSSSTNPTAIFVFVHFLKR